MNSESRERFLLRIGDLTLQAVQQHFQHQDVLTEKDATIRRLKTQLADTNARLEAAEKDSADACADLEHPEPRTAELDALDAPLAESVEACEEEDHELGK